MTPDIAEIDTTDTPADAGDGFRPHTRRRNRPSSPTANRIEIIADTTTRRQVTLPTHVPTTTGVGRGDRLQLNQKEIHRA